MALRLVSRTFTHLESKTEANAATGAFGLKAKHMRLLGEGSICLTYVDKNSVKKKEKCKDRYKNVFFHVYF